MTDPRITRYDVDGETAMTLIPADELERLRSGFDACCQDAARVYGERDRARFALRDAVDVLCRIVEHTKEQDTLRAAEECLARVKKERNEAVS